MPSVPQPYLSLTSVTSKMSRPMSNGTMVSDPDWANANMNGGRSPHVTNYGSWKHTRPIKHWRKQLQPSVGSGSRSNVSIQDQPGSNVVLTNKAYCCSDNSCGNVLYTKILSPTNHTCNYKSRPTAGMNTVHINSQNESLPIQKYNFDTKSYLRSRNKSYNTNLSGSVNQDVSLSTATQPVRSSLTFTDINCDNKCADVIVKHSNPYYYQQGSVSSSSRLKRLQYNTIQTNASSFRDIWGASAATAANYYGNGNSPYFIKTKNNICNPSNYYSKNKKIIC